MDDETGLYYLRARYYDPTVGRFINEDTYGGQIKNPLSINLYTYVNNDPLNRIDPLGHYDVILRDYAEEWGATVYWTPDTTGKLYKHGGYATVYLHGMKMEYTETTEGIWFKKDDRPLYKDSNYERMMYDSDMFQQDFFLGQYARLGPWPDATPEPKEKSGTSTVNTVSQHLGSALSVTSIAIKLTPYGRAGGLIMEGIDFLGNANNLVGTVTGIAVVIEDPTPENILSAALNVAGTITGFDKDSIPSEVWSWNFQWAGEVLTIGTSQ